MTRAASGALVAVLLAVVGASAGPVQASHYRGANASWQAIGPNTAEITLTQAWRASAFPGAVGDEVVLNARDFGDGVSEGNRSTIIALNQAEDWLIGRAVNADDTTLTHVYSGPGPWDFGFESCCTISTLNNSPDSFFRNTLPIDFSKATRSPRTSVPPIVDVGPTGTQTFTIPALAPPAPCNTLSFRLTDPMASLHTNPPGFAINPTTGSVTWDTTGLNLGLYIASVTIEGRNATEVCSSIEAQFLLRVTNTPNKAPDWVAPTPADQTEFTVIAGSPLDVDLRAADPDPADTVHIDNIGLPVGSTFTFVDGNPADAEFKWTPTGTQVGEYLVTFTAQDQNLGSALPRTIVIKVVDPPKATKLVAHPAIAQVVPGLKVNLKPSATLTSGSPLPGRTVKFTTASGSAICSAKTDAQGLASCSGLVPLLQATLSLGYRASYAGEPGYLGSSAKGALSQIGSLSIGN